ncbi:hypothetical protein [Tanticharoenia sakaeratensis]|uniref:DegT/DnrJ/EryC1/StrS aminotransferase n=1 Tax=Tanticharoenia sakaeratensis NBRC 103193 TaxID=1231623 RepID=A0A0D6MNA0_9PROT|nr:hypothetical protein [Tanticharoenia sakaeratensis]GAN54743.1 DegT/DnrJ/EryC1/StrS aminotransferase [Tanticharoenia sakaeratensis NBRC 103193]GBQ23198.1 DegT/DnrJ/EryC1/StrS aminotransferase [Tanticharoenia sakaeratensis NBRC 103193]
MRVASAAAGTSVPHYPLTVVGLGPAGLAPLLAAAKSGQLEEILSRGIILIDRADEAGPGRIGNYAITSDSSAATFLSCLVDCPVPSLAALVDHPVARTIADLGVGCVPLALAGELMRLVGRAIVDLVEAAPACRVMLGTELLTLRQMPSRNWVATVRHAGRVETFTTRSVLAATGADQRRARLASEAIGGVPLLPRFDHKVIQSEQMLAHGGVVHVAHRLAGISSPRIAIIGGSTSAMASANLLLRSGIPFNDGGVRLLHRTPITVFYPSVQAALEDGYTDFDAQRDVCPVSGFLFRFGGFRFDSRELVRRALKIGGGQGETRLAFQQIATDQAVDTAVQSTLEEADLIISCLGYTPRGLPVLGQDGAPIALGGVSGGTAMVDPECSIIDSQGRSIPGLFGVGLAAGYRPPAHMGGEASFTGQVNGLWLWQNDVGRLIAARMLAHAADTADMIAA